MKYYFINHRDNEMEGYRFNFDGSDDNFNFNDGYDDDVQNFSRMFILLFCSLLWFLDVWKIRISI